jgi:ATP-dependent protease Clp ATPase subunit
VALNTNQLIVVCMGQFDGMHLCINTCIDKRKLEFARKKLEPQCDCMIVYICVAIGDQVMKRWQIWGYQPV